MSSSSPISVRCKRCQRSVYVANSPDIDYCSKCKIYCIPAQCVVREWLEDDEILPTGEQCINMAEYISCWPFIRSQTCSKHKCRCEKKMVLNNGSQEEIKTT